MGGTIQFLKEVALLALSYGYYGPPVRFYFKSTTWFFLLLAVDSRVSLII